MAFRVNIHPEVKRKEVDSMKNPELFTADGTPENLPTLYLKDNCSAVMIEDAVEESRTGAELAANMNKLKLFSKFKLDRETDEYARLVTTDCWGCTHYFKAWK